MIPETLVINRRAAACWIPRSRGYDKSHIDFCPTGKSVTGNQRLSSYLSSPFRKNISLSPSGKSNVNPPPSRPKEGRIAIVTGGCGMRRTRRDRAPQFGGCLALKSACEPRRPLAADGKAVWSWHPLLVSRLAAEVNSVSENLIPATVTRRIRSPGRARNKPLKPLRAGECRVDSGEPVVTTLVCFFNFRTRGCGCSGHPAFPAPSVFRGETVHANLGRIAPRERGVMFGCLEKQMIRSIAIALFAQAMDFIPLLLWVQPEGNPPSDCHVVIAPNRASSLLFPKA